FTTTCRSPRTPSPVGESSGGGGSPSPATRTAWPSEIPGGILTASLRFLGTRPLPRHPSHSSLMMTPRPAHVGQAVTMRNMPPSPACCTLPCPPHVGHVAGFVPGLAPEPWHLSHTSSR